MSKRINVIWIDENYENEENNLNINELGEYNQLKIKCFKEVDTGMEYIKQIQFEETNIIISGELYIQFIKKFIDNLKDIYIIPKIIIFTKNVDRLKNNNEYKKYSDNSFYCLGGIKTTFQEIKEFIIKPLTDKVLNREDEGNLTFEYIDCKEQLYYPLLYKSLMDTTNIDNLETFTNTIYEKHKDNNIEIADLLKTMKNIDNIPVELLSKYYARLYTAESVDNKNNFYSNINKDLRENKKDNYLSYIKVLYEGLKTKSLSLASNKELYRGTRLKNKEIERLKIYKDKKKEGLPSAIVFSKAFLSFSKSEFIAKNFLVDQKNDNEFSKVLFILEKDDNLSYDLSTHADIEKISFKPGEKEVLFFPFSSFEIKDIDDKNYFINNEKIIIIKLLYLGKYLKDLKKNINNINSLPNSEFKQQFLETGLVERKKINDTPQYMLQKYNQYKKELENNHKDNYLNNYIINEIEVKENDINKDVRIINSFEQCIRNLNNESNKGENRNEKEIKDNIEITINDNVIPFSYFHKFKEEGKYTIKYTFKNNLTNINHLFYECKSLKSIDLSHLNAKNVSNMSNMFYNCNSLTNIDLSNINTKNVTNMSYMFYGCKSLTNIDLSNINTQNVINMSYMFDGCSSLTSIYLSNSISPNITDMSYMFSHCDSLSGVDLSNFNTQNLTNIRCMFYGCKSVKNINLSTFNTKNVTDMSLMFFGCNSLISVNLSNIDTQKVKNLKGMFLECDSLLKKNIFTNDKKVLEEYSSNH